VRVAATLVFVAALAGSVSAQAQPDAVAEVPATALLQVGPDSRRGIDAIAPDVTPHWYGRYRVGGALVELRYARAPLPAPAEWPRVECEARLLRSADGRLHYYEHRTGWSLLAVVSSGELPPSVSICGFVDRFVARHLVFENLEEVPGPDAPPVFPAVIEL